MSERLDIRLSEEEKRRLAELAKQRGVSMTDLVRMWIMRGDVVHVLAEQLQDITNDFARWHVLENRSTSIHNLCENLRGRVGTIEDEMKRRIMYQWIEFFLRSFQLMRNDVSDLTGRLTTFITQKEPKEKMVLVHLIKEFTQIIISYNNVFVRSFIEILQNMDKYTKRDTGARYNDDFRTRYNEIASKCEDFLKRAERELGETLQQAIPRAKEFRAKE
jgi:hypothetical protein